MMKLETGLSTQRQRRLLARVAYSTLLYGVELWAGAVRYARYRGILEALYRRCCLRISAY